MRHRFHALCPYFAMFPETFAEHWIDRLTRPGDLVLDPFAGRGTAPFQALLMNRRGIGVDVSPVAYVVTRAKINAPPRDRLIRRLRDLEQRFEPAAWEPVGAAMPDFFGAAYSRRTLQQVLFLRESLRWRRSDTDCMLAALILGALHGESNRSSSYLSNQMPHAISTKPAYSVRYWQKTDYKAPERDAFQLLRNRVAYRYETGLPTTRGAAHHADMRDVPRLLSATRTRVQCVITSPPYLNVTNFEEDQWLRNWFLGGPPFPTRNRLTNDNRHLRADPYWSLISDMWRVLGVVLAKGSNVVIRIGAKRESPKQLARSLLAASTFAHRTVSLVSSEASEIKNRQTDSFRPGSRGCLVEVDCHFAVS